ncbi:MAG: DUF1524 domain-containing protein, partial [Pseudomonadota bacterium]
LFKGSLDASTRVEASEVVREFVTSLTYGDSSDRIRSTLLLFNIATLLENTGSKYRFPFDLYEKQRWDIEHIRSVTEYRPQRIEDQKAWLGQVRKYWEAVPPADEHSDLPAESDRLLADFDRSRFEKLYERIVEAFGELVGTEVDNHIGNLTLLDDRTNRSYKNAVFPIKRQRILELDKIGTFVPLCTTNVFLKYYSRSEMGLLHWTKDDAEAYQDAMVKTLATFFLGGDV